MKLRFPENKYLPFLAVVHFFSMWGIYSALSYDYHDNVMAAMFVPWLFYFFVEKKFGHAALFLLALLLFFDFLFPVAGGDENVIGGLVLFLPFALHVVVE